MAGKSFLNVLCPLFHAIENYQFNLWLTLILLYKIVHFVLIPFTNLNWKDFRSSQRIEGSEFQSQKNVKYNTINSMLIFHMSKHRCRVVKRFVFCMYLTLDKRPSLRDQGQQGFQLNILKHKLCTLGFRDHYYQNS